MTISFDLHAKTADEIDLEKCNFLDFGSSVTLTLTLDPVEVTLVCIRGQGLPHTKLHGNRKNFLSTYGRTDGLTRLQIVDVLGHRRGDDLKIGLRQAVDQVP